MAIVISTGFDNRISYTIKPLCLYVFMHFTCKDYGDIPLYQPADMNLNHAENITCIVDNIYFMVRKYAEDVDTDGRA